MQHAGRQRGPPADGRHHTEMEGVEKILAGLNPAKAAGPGGIPPRMLRELSREIAPILTTIYRSSLNTGAVPGDWREALVSPVLKKGAHDNPINYRPISLTSIPCKVLEHILTSATMTHLDSHILTPRQHGFRKRRSCETQLLEFIDEVSSTMERGIPTDVIVMDFAKAFDRVNHSLLVHKLDHYGIRGSTNRWIANFLHGRKQAVVVDGAKSGYIDVTSGVPQGSVLGPCLFLAYINDLPQRVSSPCRQFADDTILYRFVTTAQDRTTLQEDLGRLEDWASEWDMTFHPDKCSRLSLTRSRNNEDYDYVLHGHTLATVSSAKYLGVTIQSNIGWEAHINNICAKGNRMLGFLRRNLKVASRHIKETAYKAIVRPILEYASSVWDPHTTKLIRKLEMIQRRAARFCLNRHHNTFSVDAMLTTLAWPTLQQRRKQARLTMLYKIRNGLVTGAYPQLVESAGRRRRTHDRTYQRIPCRTDYRRYCFLPRTICDWNSLPHDTVHSLSLGTFRSRVSKSQ